MSVRMVMVRKMVVRMARLGVVALITPTATVCLMSRTANLSFKLDL